MFRLYRGFRSFASVAKYDVLIIGSGPGGYVAAIKCAQLGLKTACIEKHKTLGGTCLNVGCIPSKSLLHSSHMYSAIKKDTRRFGISVDNLRFDLSKMMKAKDDTVLQLTRGIEYLFKKNKVDRIHGTAEIVDRNQVKVTGLETSQIYHAENIVIATGSEPMSIPGLTINEKTVVSSTGALSLSKVPSTLVVVGGGVIGLELGSVWNRLGSKVIVVEYLDAIGSGMDAKTSKYLQKVLSAQGIEFKLGTKVVGITQTGDQQEISLESKSGKETIQANVVLVSVGRIPNTTNLGLEKTGNQNRSWKNRH